MSCLRPTVLAILGLVACVPDADASLDLRRVRLEPLARTAFLRSLDAAAASLASPGCASLLDAFEDRDGRSLRRRLDDQGLGAPDYLRRVVFVEGRGEAACRRSDVLAFTSPGSRVVRVCGDRFRQLALREPAHAQAVVIHEMLHTLGLGEQPPSPAEITARVREACAL